MSSPRVRRLRSDYERVTSRFKDWPLVQVELAEGLPPDQYRIRYSLTGLHLDRGEIMEQTEHVLEISLGLEYPHRAPKLRLLTPIFHPNFNETEVCAQDVYAASEGLDDLIVRIGRMIAYQDYNIKSPLNGIAAKWASENSARLPVDPREVGPPSLEINRMDRPPPLPPPTEPRSPLEWASEIIIHQEEITTPHSQTVPAPADPETIRFCCRYCGQHLEADHDMFGESVDCPACNHEIMVGP